MNHAIVRVYVLEKAQYESIQVIPVFWNDGESSAKFVAGRSRNGILLVASRSGLSRLCIGGKLRKWTTRLLRYQGAWVTRVCRDAILSSRIKFSVAIVCVRVTFGVGVFAAAAIPFLGSSDSSGCLAGSSTARLWWWISWFRRLFFEDAIALDSTRLAVYTREDFIAFLFPSLAFGARIFEPLGSDRLVHIRNFPPFSSSGLSLQLSLSG